MNSPVIGISCYVEPAKWGAWDITAAVLPFEYVSSVTNAGGRAVILPPDQNGGHVVNNLDGLIRNEDFERVGYFGRVAESFHAFGSGIDHKGPDGRR